MVVADDTVEPQLIWWFVLFCSAYSQVVRGQVRQLQQEFHQKWFSDESPQ